jgi:hypothetical protein
VGSKFRLQDIETPDNPTWLAPEILAGKTNMDVLREQQTPVLKELALGVAEEIRSVLPKETQTAMTALTKSILMPSVREGQGAIEFTSKSDTWAVGVMALDLWTGQTFLSGEGFLSKVQDKIAAFRSNPDNMAIGPLNEDGTPVPGSLTGSTGDVAVDTLINNLMHPVAGSRPDLQDVMSDPVFTRPGIGSDEVRALIVALTSGDPDAIDRASAKLKQVTGG